MTYRYQNDKRSCAIGALVSNQARSITVECHLSQLNDLYSKLDCFAIVTVNSAKRVQTGPFTVAPTAIAVEKIEKNARRRGTVARWMQEHRPLV